MSVVERIREIGIVPVVRATSAAEALEAVEAIRAGGIPILEITLTVPGAVQIIGDLSRRIGDAALIGAGRSSTPKREKRIDAGARFIVSPSLDIPTIDLCRRLAPLLRGPLTPHRKSSPPGKPAPTP